MFADGDRGAGELAGSVPYVVHCLRPELFRDAASPLVRINVADGRGTESGRGDGADTACGSPPGYKE